MESSVLETTRTVCLGWCCWCLFRRLQNCGIFFLPCLWSSRGQSWKVSVWGSTQNLKWNVTNEKKFYIYNEQNRNVVFGILNWIPNSPVDHTRWTSLSEGEASRRVCGRFRIHGGRRGRVWPTCRGWRSFTGTARCSVSRTGVWKKDKCHIGECTPQANILILSFIYVSNLPFKNR